MSLAMALRGDHSEWHNRPLSAREIDRMAEEVARSICVALNDAPFLNAEIVRKAAAEFIDSVGQCPIEQASGGCGFNGGVLLFCISRLLQPETVIESGLFRGYTTWVLRRAAPDARMFCFDVTFRELRHRDPKAIYVEQDWDGFSFDGFDPSTCLAFFDDHVSQLLRMEQCMTRGIRHAMFDDCHPAHRLRGEAPAFPTVAMVMDADRLGPEPARWITFDRVYEYAPEIERMVAARDRSIVWPLPDLYSATGYKPAHNTLVEFRTP
jgi:hypothetical protein